MDNEVDVTDNLKKAVSALEPKRTKLFNAILDNPQYQESKECILVIKRFVERENNIEGVSQIEIVKYHVRFVDDFWHVLPSKNLSEEIQTKISFINNYCQEIAVTCRHVDKDFYPEQFFHITKAANDSKYAKYLSSFMMWIKFPQDFARPQVNQLTLTEIALTNIYNGELISRKNSTAIAEKQGWNSKNSGHKLYQQYNKYCKDRTRDTGTEKKRQNRITLLKGVLVHLTLPEAIQSAKDDIEKLESLPSK